MLMSTKLKEQRYLAQLLTNKHARNTRLCSLDYEQGQEAKLSPTQKFTVENFLPVIDKFVLSL